MLINAATPEEYISKLPEDRAQAIERLLKTIRDNLPPGFEEVMDGMIVFVIPFSLYPPGYHVNPKEPVPFMGLASQKNYIAFYHMGIEAFPEILKWFQEEYPKHVNTKLDMGKSCIRFKNVKKIPYDLVGELCQKITPEDYLKTYENFLKTRVKKSK
ncbi:DUF1801 domain-containing protein [Acetobacterium bakii]|uniref:YdhG-like domain-containing protein n=1 Tax=Acetobacterium bakii TaxID=52689 RepID=A0A0L6TX68_9FIRM|nr:DUF1801 domain-containing protein [Acetobacterium bakii]KNZ40833.1 hypothetical protein AKG39_15355 [Acetobacterium bakii]